MKRAPRPPYSPDLAPCDFYLFGYIKRLVARCEFVDRSKLLQAVMDILNGIEKTTLEEIVLTWLRRLANSINTNGEYVE
jgi:hypothetical protein